MSQTDYQSEAEEDDCHLIPVDTNANYIHIDGAACVGKRCIKHYSNRQKILLVGEGDFSFSDCLANAFGSASNITATSLDSRDSVIRKYSKGENNLRAVEDGGAIVLHQVDVATMHGHPQLQYKLFDRIVFNFPHAGDNCLGGAGREHDPWYIGCHKRVVERFFSAARYMVADEGEIHITHKTAYPFDAWNIEELAEDVGLVLLRKEPFSIWDYPGYVNKRAYGISWDSTFPVGASSTFMFATKTDAPAKRLSTTIEVVSSNFD